MLRILLSAFFTVVLATTLRSQSSFPAIQKSMDYFSKDDYVNTIRTAEPALATVKQEFGENSPFYSGLVFFLAISHFREFEYEKAEPYFLIQLQLQKKSPGENSLQYISTLNGLGLLYREMGRYKESEDVYAKAVLITKNAFGADTAYAKSLNNQASLYHFLGQYAKAETIYNEAAAVIKAKTGVNSALYATALNNLCTLYSDMGDSRKAKPLMLQVVQIRKQVLGETDRDYAGALNNLAYTLASLGEYRDAEKYYLMTESIFRKTVGENDVDYATCISNLGQLYKTMGQYDKAERYFLQANDIRKRALGVNHPDYALGLNNLGGLYEFSGRYDDAERLFLEAASIVKKNLGEEHPDYVTSLNNLASLYDETGNFGKAEPLYVRACALRKKLLGEKHPSYAMSLNNLATLYQEIGQRKKAEALYLQALGIWKNSLGEHHPDYASCLNNLAVLYEDMEQYSKAEPLYLQAMSIRKEVFGPNHTDYAASLNNLAGLYSHLNQPKKAEPLLLQARDIWKRTVGENNPIYATSLNNLGALYRRAQTNYREAEQYYLQSLELRKRLLGLDHPLTASVQNDLALLYINMSQPDRATPLLLNSSQSIARSLLDAFPVLSEKEKANYIKQNLYVNECNNSFLYLYPQAAALTVNNNVDLQLFFKSLSLADTRNMLQTIESGSDTALKRLVRTWENAKSILAKQYALPLDRRMPDLKAREREVEDLEKEIGRRSAAFRGEQQALRISVKDVQEKLDADEAAIEFVSFRLFDKKSTDSIMYLAYVIRKNDTVAHMVPLFEEGQLQRILDSAGKSATGMAHTFYRGVDIKDRSAASLDHSLYNLLWAPLEPYLKGIHNISYSPSGKLYGVAFHALKIDSSHLLMDKYKLRQYTSTREIALRDALRPAVRPRGITLFGNANFSMDSVALSATKKKSSEVAADATVMRGAGDKSSWPDLPGTAKEVNRIADIFRQKHLAANAYLQDNATEENFKHLAETNPQVIHIATHGFFLPEKKNDDDPDRNVYSHSKNPLLRSGLILSGGNYAWNGGAPIDGVEDGIVTAYEISQMNLSGTDLVVLSACETALGDIKGNEGVYGLQRAFKMAGVRQMIVSLWQVPDTETAELMGAFYTYWINGLTIEEAFQKAQAEMRAKYSPFYWAAFVLIK